MITRDKVLNNRRRKSSNKLARRVEAKDGVEMLIEHKHEYRIDVGVTDEIWIKDDA